MKIYGSINLLMPVRFLDTEKKKVPHFISFLEAGCNSNLLKALGQTTTIKCTNMACGLPKLVWA